MSAVHGKNTKRLLVISLDGFPWTMLNQNSNDWFPSLARHLPMENLRQMDSIYPTVSSVAWSSYISGQNPGGHGIFGFIDRSFKPFQLTLPNSLHRKGPVLWDQLGNAGLKSILVNIPVTYPPAPVNGVLVSGFLGVNLAKSVYPPELYPILKSMDYVIDADTSDASDEPELFLKRLEHAVDNRCRTFGALLQTHQWDFAHLHIMETDRLFHFLWSHVINTDSLYHAAIVRLMNKIDSHIASILELLNESDSVICMSDHGFCSAEIEFNLNAWLADNNWLKWESEGSGLQRISGESRCYSLLPGRMYFNLQDREPQGFITETDLPKLKKQLSSELLKLKIPGSNRPVISAVLDGSMLYQGQCQNQAPDLIAVPENGVELKGRLAPAPLIQPSKLQGTHTVDDAFIWSSRSQRSTGKPCITDLYPTILSHFGLSAENAEGTGLINW